MDENKNIEENKGEQLNKASSDENISQAASPVTYNPQPSTIQEMEVHHHSHQSHGKKNWKAYFWEFLMLFLAVFCGFLAEYQLEHKIEKQRAKEFATSLVSDLEKDTAQFNYGIKEIDFVAPRIDTFRTLVHSTAINSLPGGIWYYYGRFTSYYFSFTSNDATIEQLKNSGSLRYFKKSEIVNAIAQYDKISRLIKDLFNYEQPINNKMIELRNKIFIAANFDSIMKFNTSREKINSFMKKEIKFLDSNPATIIELANFCQTSVVDSYYRRLKYQDALKLASDLMRLLKKEYHLK